MCDVLEGLRKNKCSDSQLSVGAERGSAYRLLCLNYGVSLRTE